MFFNDISERLRTSRSVEKWKDGKSQLSPVNAVDSLAACMNLILVEREFLTKGTTGRGTRRSEVEFSAPRDRGPINVPANVTKSFFLFFFPLFVKQREQESRRCCWRPPTPLAKWNASAKMPFLSVHTTVCLRFCFQYACAFLNGPRMERIFRWGSSYQPQTHSFVRLTYGHTQTTYTCEAQWIVA